MIGLLSYGADIRDIYRRSATLAHEIESDMPSHAVGLSQVRSPATVMHRVALDGHEIHGGHADSKRCNHLCPDCDHTHK
jgi:hypothetical protein